MAQKETEQQNDIKEKILRELVNQLREMEKERDRK